MSVDPNAANPVVRQPWRDDLRVVRVSKPTSNPPEDGFAVANVQRPMGDLSGGRIACLWRDDLRVVRVSKPTSNPPKDGFAVANV